MTENKNPFDEHFQRKLSDFESPIPEDMFDRTQARRGAALPSDTPMRKRLEGFESSVPENTFDAILEKRARRKRRILFWRTATAMAAIWLLGMVLFEFKNRTSDSAQPTESNVSAAKTIEPSASESSPKSENIETPLPKKGTLSEQIGQTGQKNVKNGDYTEGGQKLKLEPNLTSKQLNTVLTDKNTEGTNLGLGDNIVKSNTLNATEYLKNADKENTIAQTNSSPAATTTTSLSLPVGTATNAALSALDFLNIKTPTLVERTFEEQKNPCSDPGNGCPTFRAKRRGMGEKSFYIDAFVAPEYVMRSFTKKLPESEKLLAARDSIEKTQYAVSTGIRGSLVFGNGLAVRLGAVYNQINERARFDSLGTGAITTTYKVNVLANGLLDTVSITTLTTDGIFRKTRHNRYRSIDIPLQIGYEMPLKNGWRLGINGGVNFNITAWQKADIVGENLRQLSVSSGINQPNAVFNTRLGMSVLGSVAAYKELTNGLQLVLEPSIRLGLQPITRGDYALKQQYTTAGLIVGLRFRL
jgi:hypothetical protein